jgi:hypothetical protein
LIWAIVLARLFVPLLIPRYPLVIIVALVLDAVDGSLLEAFTTVDTGPDGPYQSFDKALDIYYLSIAYIATMRNWVSQTAVRVAQFLFYYRLVGVLAFELTSERAMLLIFPNTFEFYFIAYSVIALRFDPARCGPRFWIATAAVLWIFVKLPQEYWIHVAQLDFTDAVADHPWFGVLSVLFILALVAVALFVVRPRAGPPDWAWRFAADPLPETLDEAHERHAHRLRRGGVLWGELFEKAALLSLMCVIFAEILPSVETSALEVGVAVVVIVIANTAVSMWSARSDRIRNESFAALLAANLAFIYVLSTFFTAAENFPLGTALFFAFLITLLLWLYDVYKPVYDVRFQAARSILTGTSGSNSAQSTVA